MAFKVVVFADLVGFTALTEAHGDSVATRLIDDLTTTLASIAEPLGLRTVKTMGDGFLLIGDDATSCMTFALGAVQKSNEADAQLGMRIGMHSGEVSERNGDVFGRTVNLAARVLEEAQLDEVLLTADVLKRAQVPRGGRVARVGSRSLRGIRSAIVLYRLRPTLETQKATDPVCQMRVAPGTAFELSMAHKTYHFCSERCRAAFTEDPESFVRLSLKSRWCLLTKVQRDKDGSVATQWS